jgi:hypothetical protein
MQRIWQILEGGGGGEREGGVEKTNRKRQKLENLLSFLNTNPTYTVYENLAHTAKKTRCFSIINDLLWNIQQNFKCTV